MDRLAAAHETAGDVERAEALYLRMLAWREGADQFEAWLLLGWDGKRNMQIEGCLFVHIMHTIYNIQ